MTHTKLFLLLSQVITVNNRDKELVLQYFEPVLFKNGAKLVESVKTAKWSFFINEVFARRFHYEGGREITNHLAEPVYPFYNFFSQLRPLQNDYWKTLVFRG